MTASLERRYRRLLRLLPAGYRQAWEEDMVSAFLQSSEGSRSPGLTLGEGLSVAILAVRLRLTGSPTSTRRWQRAAYGLAVMLLLYQALFATVGLAYVAGQLYWRPQQIGPDDPDLWLGVAYGLLWIAAFGCAVFGRVMAARILAPLSVVPISLPFVVWADRFDPRYLVVAVWPLLCAALTFAIPRTARPSRRLWLGAYLMGSLLLAPASALAFAPRDWRWLQLIDLGLGWRLALLVAIIVVLATPALRRSPGWLITLALLGIGALVDLVGFVLPVPIYGPATPAGMVVVRSLNLVLFGLGVTCAVVGLRALRGRRRSAPGPA